VWAWVLGAAIAVADGLVWAELGAAFPRAGGSYAFLREIYGPKGAGNWLSFLYVWQLSFSAPLSIASGCIGLSSFLEWFWPGSTARQLRLCPRCTTRTLPPRRVLAGHVRCSIAT
jgi:amino acid transporter